MSFPQATWVATPDKTNHETKGYTSKVIFNFQSTEPISVANEIDIFDELIANNLNFKGIPNIPPGYFVDCDGRTLRITMYFYKQLDGDKMDLSQGLYDIDNDVSNTVATPNYTTDVDNLGGLTLARYECVISSFFDPSFIPSGRYLIQGIGNITYANSTDGTKVIMEPFTGGSDLSGGSTSEYKLTLTNNCGSHDILVLSLIVEEIS
jgi:hypothetical protein